MVGEAVAVVGTGGVGDQSGGFVYCENVLVFVQDLQLRKKL